MRVIAEHATAGEVDAVALAPGGGRVVALGSDGLTVWTWEDGLPGQAVSFRLTDDRYQASDDARVGLQETRVSFRDATTVLVARAVALLDERGRYQVGRTVTTLDALDVRNGERVGSFQCDGGMMLTVPPVPLGPGVALLSLLGKTLLAVDLATGRELARVRELDDRFDPVGDGAAVPEERVAPNGVAFDPRTNRLHVLWRYFNAGVIQTYQWDSERPGFNSLGRSPMIEGRGWGHEANGLALSPDGRTVAAWLPIFDQTLDPRHFGPDDPPKSARLGHLAVVRDGGEPHLITVASDLDRDFLVSRERQVIDGETRFLGFRLSAEEGEARPFFRDDDHVVVNTPGGALLDVDLRTGQVDVAHEPGTAPVAIDADRGSQRLLVADGEGTLRLLGW